MSGYFVKVGPSRQLTHYASASKAINEALTHCTHKPGGEPSLLEEVITLQSLERATHELTNGLRREKSGGSFINTTTYTQSLGIPKGVTPMEKASLRLIPRY